MHKSQTAHGWYPPSRIYNNKPWEGGGGGVKYQKGSQKSKHNIPGHKITNVPTVGTFLKYLPVPTCFALRKLLYAAMMQKYKRRHTMLMYNAELH